jgi:tryptophan synthase beta chain
MVGVEAAGAGLATGRHSASITEGQVGVLHGKKTFVLQDELGQVREAHSIAPGLDYPGVGPEHAYLKESGRASYTAVDDSEAIQGLQLLTESEGIIPALESAHAVACAAKVAPRMHRDQIIIVNLSGRGDKDMNTVAQYLGVSL